MKMEVHVFVSSAQIGRRHAYISVIMKAVQRKENKIDAHTHSLSAKKEKLHPSTKGSSNWREHHWSYIITIIRWLSSQKAFCMQIQSCVQCIRPGWSPSVQETSLRTQLCILRNPAVKAIANQTHLVRHICASPFAGKLKGSWRDSSNLSFWSWVWAEVTRFERTCQCWYFTFHHVFWVWK